jgi:hypothetical protein
MHMPTRPLLAMLWLRVRVGLRGLRFSATDDVGLDTEAAAPIDLCWSLSSGLGLIDPLRGAYFQTRSLLAALDRNDQRRVGRGLAGEAAYSASRGQAGGKRAHVLLAEAESLAHRLADPYAKAITLLMAGLSCHLMGQFGRSREKLQAAETTLRGECAGTPWELDTVRQFLMEDLYYLGDLVAFQRLIESGLRQAVDRGSLYAATNLRTGLANSLWLMRDDAARARQEADQAIERWSRKGFHVQHWYHLVATVQSELYGGHGSAAFACVEQHWSQLKRVHFFHIQHTRIAACHLRVRTALAAAREAEGKEQRRYTKIAQQGAEWLARQQDDWARAFAKLTDSALCALNGERDTAAQRLQSAIRMLEQDGLSLFAHAAQIAGHGLLPGDRKDLRETLSWKWMVDRGVHNPAALSGMLAPGLS